MGVDPEVIAALERAVAGDPRNVALRVHLSGLLLAAEQPARALEEAQAALAIEPAHSEALASASRAARAGGLESVADGYDALLAAIAPGDASPTSVARPIGSEDAAFEAELQAMLDNESNSIAEVDASPLTLADVGGMEDVKQAIERTFLGPMRNPELRKMYGKSLRGGLLLYGPPGCGKTLLARAIAGELGASFHAFGLTDVLDSFMGASERNLHALFDHARRDAPCVLFIDELDALGHKRTNLARSMARSVVVQLLTELDGIDAENEGLFVLGATNQPWDVDPALRRPGRFDRTVLVIPPDEPARARILELHLRDRPVDKVNLASLASKAKNFSGADLRLVCDTAAELAIEDSLALGRPRPIRVTDLTAAIEMVRPSTLSWFEAARNFVTFANTSGEYDDLLAYMRKNRLL
jgi:SpoVK/Ycf46/Vps4 family AAA+-type ATPase